MKPVLLLVDYNSEMLKVLAGELGEKYQVLTALNGQEALKALAKETIHLIVSDLMAPVMDGFELCKTIKTNLEYSHVPVILLTAKIVLQSHTDGQETGAHTQPDEAFLNQLTEAIHTNLDGQELDVDKMAQMMNVSHTGLFRKIKSITDLTPN